MKNIILGLVLGAALGGLGAWWFGNSGHEEKAPEKKEEAHGEQKESFLQHTTNGQTFLKLDAAAQARSGLQVAALTVAQLKPEVKTFGRVLDPAPLAAMVSELAVIENAMQAALKEQERLRRLAQDQNASARAIEAAETTVQQSRLQIAAIQERIALAWGKAVASRSDLSAFIRQLIQQTTVLVRLDLPLGSAISGQPLSAQVAPLSAEDSRLEARFLSAVTSADPLTQGQGFMFQTDPGQISLPPGCAVVGWMTIPGQSETGVLVPREALIRHEGENFVYVQTGAETFERVEVVVKRFTDRGAFVIKDIKTGDKVVVAGAQQLLSEELKAKGGAD
ncbi:MAG: hypothetical protein WCO56_08010 [Verrucomicrobiota bacterium]